jgi:hypothetical protein
VVPESGGFEGQEIRFAERVARGWLRWHSFGNPANLPLPELATNAEQTSPGILSNVGTRIGIAKGEAEISAVPEGNLEVHLHCATAGNRKAHVANHRKVAVPLIRPAPPSPRVARSTLEQARCFLENRVVTSNAHATTVDIALSIQVPGLISLRVLAFAVMAKDNTGAR